MSNEKNNQDGQSTIDNEKGLSSADAAKTSDDATIKNNDADTLRPNEAENATSVSLQETPGESADHVQKTGTEAPQVPVIVSKARFSKIWLLPILAVLIGLGMVYNDWRNRGIHIQVEFETAEGLVAKKTVLKNRNVDIGIVKKINFSEDKLKILVDIEVDKSMDSFLVEDSEFWVVRPRFGATGFTGIATLVSGAYIEVSPGQSNIEEFEFKGLETPPVTSLNADGIHLKLVSRGTKALKVGNPVLHKGFEVGAVESKYYDDLEQEAHYDIFIQAPFHNLVTKNTSFWNVSGLSLSTSTQGVRFEMASIDALIAGGVEFGLLDGASPGQGVAQNYQFQVYDSIENIEEQRDYKYIEYVLLVDDSVGGLHRGSPVEYRGIRLGTVSNTMEFWQVIDIAGVGKEERIPVLIKLEPERLMKNGYIALDVFQGIVDEWIREGLTASIESANIITGSLKISLKPGGEPVDSVEKFGNYPVIPSVPGGFASMTEKFESILTNIEQLPLQETLENLNALIDTADKTVKTSGGVIERASATLTTLEHSLAELQTTLKGLQPDSQVYRSVEQMIKKIEVTLDEIKPIVKEVTNQPNSLVFGTPAGADKQPKSTKQKGK